MKLNEITNPSTNNSREEQLVSKREQSLAHLNLEQQRLCVSTLLGSSYDSSDLYKTVRPAPIKDDFIKSISGQWYTSGKLSEKQVAAVLKFADRMAEAEARAEMVPPIHVNQREDFIGVVTGIEDYETTDFNGAPIVTNRISMKCRYGILVTFKTNRKNLLDQMKQLIASGKKIKLTSKVLWVAPKLDRVSVASMGLRYEDYVEK